MTFVKICQANPDFVEIGETFWAIYMKTKVVFIVFGHTKLPKKAPSSIEMVLGC